MRTTALLLFVLSMSLLAGLIAVGTTSAETTRDVTTATQHTSLGAPTTVITVTSTLDFAEADDDLGNVDNYTCSYTSGAIFKPAPNGICTLRRAILEAGVRPDADRPISIVFNIPEADPNYDATLDLWEVQIDSSFIWELDRRFISDDGGQVTIDGDSQPGGRADGPKIMIDTNSDNSPIFGRSLEVRTSNNIIRNLGFHGGGQIILYEASNLVEGVWMGLTNDGSAMQLAYESTGAGDVNIPQALNGEARGGIIMPNSASDNNTIRNNYVIGAFERAIRITSTGSGNLIENNFIGTNSDGNIPASHRPFDCSRDKDHDASLWYGGEGLQVTGSNNTVRNNTIVGLHKTQTANETPPIAMEIYGNNNTVTGNIVGKDASGTIVGTCGQGLLFGGTESIATQNEFYFTRNGFDPVDIGDEPDSVMITQSFTGRGFGDPPRWLKVWDNVIDGGNFAESNYHTYRFGNPGVNEDLRKHVPAKVTSLSGTSISGTNGDKLFPVDPETDCGSCTVFIYLDDLDDRIESFELIGMGAFNAAGTSWTGTLDRALSATESVRTQNMTTNDTTIVSDAVPPIEYYGADTTSRLSDDFYRPNGATPLAVTMSDGGVSAELSTTLALSILLVLAAVSTRLYVKRS